MDHAQHSSTHGSLNRVALSATIHCLTGCSIGEVLGMVIGTSLGLGNWSTIAHAAGPTNRYALCWPLMRGARRPTVEN